MRVSLVFDDWNEFVFFIHHEMANQDVRLSFFERAKYEKRLVDNEYDNTPFHNLEFDWENGYMEVHRYADPILEVRK